MPVWHCEDCHRVGFYFTDEQKEAVIKEHGVLGHEATGKKEIERINPSDMSELLNGPADDIVDLLKYEENGESVIEFSRTGERYILDSNVPRRIGVEPMACSDCGNMMIYSGARNKEGLMIYDHPGPCLDKNGNNRFDQEK